VVLFLTAILSKRVDYFQCQAFDICPTSVHKTNYMEYCLSLEAGSYLAGQEIPRFYQIQMLFAVFSRVSHRTFSLAGCIQSTMPHPISYPFILPSAPTPPKWPLSFRCPMCSGSTSPCRYGAVLSLHGPASLNLRLRLSGARVLGSQ
jgi:hypothetical protein